MRRLGGGEFERLGRPSLKDLLVELLGLRLRLGPQLPLQRRHADLVLLEGGAAPALPRVEPHQRAVHDLLRHVHREQRHGRLDRLLCLSSLRLMREDVREGLHRQSAQPLLFRGQPFRERRFVDADPLQELAAIERDGPLERFGSSLTHQSLEDGGIDVHRVAVESDRLALHQQGRRLRLRQRLAEHVHRLAQASPRLLIGGITPEQRRQTVARVRLARMEREISEQGQCLLRGQGNNLPTGHPDIETAEEGHEQRLHCGCPVRVGTIPVGRWFYIFLTLPLTER